MNSSDTSPRNKLRALSKSKIAIYATLLLGIVGIGLYFLIGAGDGEGNKCKTYNGYNDQTTCVTMEDGRERCWLTYVPESVSQTSTETVPLVVVMHGYSACAETTSLYTGWSTTAETNKFIVVYPQSTENLEGAADPQPSWNAGKCCGAAVEKEIDDVSFIRKLIEVESNTERDHKVDTSRVYIGGHSNGCAMAQRMGAEASDLVAAVACHSFYLLVDAPPTYKSTPVLEVHGFADTLVPPKLTAMNWTTGAVDNFNLWGKLNKCSPEQIISGGMSDPYYTMKYPECDSGVEVELLVVPIAGHGPFKGSHAPDPVNIFQPTIKTDTTGMAYDFMKRFSRNSDGTIVKSDDPVVITATASAPGTDGNQLVVLLWTTYVFTGLGVLLAIILSCLLVMEIRKFRKLHEVSDRESLLPRAN